MKIIRLLHACYKRFISPLFGNTCRFHPSCSDYSLEAFEAHGIIKGAYLSVRRLLKCHPFSRGWFDPVPGCGESLSGHKIVEKKV